MVPVTGATSKNARKAHAFLGVMKEEPRDELSRSGQHDCRARFDRWMVPPAALCVHLCIGQAYAFSVFNLPMTKLIGVAKSAAGDWNLPELGWIFSIAIFFSWRLFSNLRPLG